MDCLWMVRIVPQLGIRARSKDEFMWGLKRGKSMLEGQVRGRGSQVT